MHAFNTAVATIMGLALVMSLFTYWIRRHWINEPLLALLLGVLTGPAGLGWLDLARYGHEREILEVTARLTLAIVLVSVGIELRSYLPGTGRRSRCCCLPGPCSCGQPAHCSSGGSWDSRCYRRS